MPREKPGLNAPAPPEKSLPATAAPAEREQAEVYGGDQLALMVWGGCFLLMWLLGLFNLLDRIWHR